MEFLAPGRKARKSRLGRSGSFFQPEKADSFQQAQSAHGIDVGCVFRRLKRDGDMALRCEVINLGGLNVFDYSNKAA